MLFSKHNTFVGYQETTYAIIGFCKKYCSFHFFIKHLSPRIAVRYGTFRICVLLTSDLEPYCTSVPYFSSIFEAYRNNVPYSYHYQKDVPYHYKKGVPYFFAKIVAPRIYVLHRTAILPVTQNLFFLVII